jgi:hypothetical protein
MADASPGWYDDGSGQQRWWDGTAWTAHIQGPATVLQTTGGEPTALQQLKDRARGAIRDYSQELSDRVAEAARNAPLRLPMQHDPSHDTDAIWAATGRPLSGIGAGRYKLTQQYLLVEKGTFSTSAQQVLTHEIVDVDVAQSIVQKARGVGTIRVHVRRASGAIETLQLEDIPDFREGTAALNRVAHEERERVILRDRTSRKQVDYSGTPPIAAVQVAVASGAAATGGTSTLNDELGRLVAYRDAEVLSEDEFAAAKRKLLGI